MVNIDNTHQVTTMLPESGKFEIVDKNGNIDYTKDFFGRRTGLTVSGQLNVETHACALTDVYTFGPTFRAENSNTSRHLAEFWMIEPEICFADLSDDMALAEDYVKFCTSYVLANCADELAYFEDEYPAGEKGLRDRLRNVVDNDFAQITYTAAIELLQRDIAAGKQFEHYPSWGDDLGSEHERYICEHIFKKPTIVINYPKGIKSFYMKLNDDNETVAAMDILVPKIGELIGGSQREDRLKELEERMVESGLKPSDLWWYCDLRRYGTVPHAGFGLGFERLIMFVTGLENIRDVIPFPRIPGHAE
jgi:asparaginyl-tRNA synthetase